MAKPQVSILIPTSGTNPLIKDCLASIRKLSYPKTGVQTIVVTNETLKKSGKAFSFAASVNLAARKAKGEFLLVTNDDIIFHKDSLTGWIEEAREHPNAILGAKIFLPKIKKGMQRFAPRTPARLKAWQAFQRNSLNQRINHREQATPLLPSEIAAPAGYTINLWTGIAHPVYTGSTLTSCDWVSGCAMLIRRKLFRKLGGFDESFTPGFFEDADLCLRARQMGISSLLSPKPKVIHAQTVSFNRNKPKKYEYWYRNKVLFLRKHASAVQLATSLTLQYGLITPARALILRDGRFLPALKGLLYQIKPHNTKPNLTRPYRS